MPQPATLRQQFHVRCCTRKGSLAGQEGSGDARERVWTQPTMQAAAHTERHPLAVQLAVLQGGAALRAHRGLGCSPGIIRTGPGVPLDSHSGCGALRSRAASTLSHRASTRREKRHRRYLLPASCLLRVITTPPQRLLNARSGEGAAVSLTRAYRPEAERCCQNHSQWESNPHLPVWSGASCH